MHINWDAVEYVLVTLFFGSVGGAISGAFVGDFFANRRDRKSRKVALLAYLAVWESDFKAGRQKYVPEANLSRPVFALFDDFRLGLIEKATAVEFDFTGNAWERYKTLLANVTGMTPGELDVKAGREKLNTAIGNLIQFVKDQ